MTDTDISARLRARTEVLDVPGPPVVFEPDLAEAADEIDRLRAEVASLKQDAAVGKGFADLWYFAMDEAPREFERIVATHQPKAWLGEIAKVRDAARRGKHGRGSQDV